MLRANGELISLCTLLDISDTGARLRLPTGSEIEVLPEFVLSLSQRGNLFRQCLLVWRERDQVGVQFIGREFTR